MVRSEKATQPTWERLIDRSLNLHIRIKILVQICNIHDTEAEGYKEEFLENESGAGFAGWRRWLRGVENGLFRRCDPADIPEGDDELGNPDEAFVP